MILRLLVVALAALAAFFSSAANADPKRWVPGHYFLMYSGTGNAAKVEQVEEIANEPEIKGAMARFYWDEMQTGQNTYNWGPTDNFIGACREAGKLCFIFVLDKGFGGSPNRNACNAPVYVQQLNGGFGCMETATGGIPRHYLQEVRDEYVRFLETLSARYDEDEGFGGVTIPESTPSVGNVAKPADFTNASWAAGLKDIYERGSAAFKHGVFIANINWLAGQVEGLVDMAHGAQSGIGWPDTLPEQCSSTGPTDAQVYLNNNYSPSQFARMGQVQEPEILNTSGNPAQGDCSLEEISAEHRRLGYSHIFWIRSSESNSVTWSQDILPHIKAGAYFNPICPSNFVDGCEC